MISMWPTSTVGSKRSWFSTYRRAPDGSQTGSAAHRAGRWEVPTTFRPDMRVPVHLLADERLLDAALGDESLTQAVNACSLPGLVSHVTVMPDVHQGYGFPIGGVAATRVSDGVVSPGAIGYDINCGVRLLASSIEFEDVAAATWATWRRRSTRTALSGVGTKGSVPLTSKELDRVLPRGCGLGAEAGLGPAEDLACTEEHGRIDGSRSGLCQPARPRTRPAAAGHARRRATTSSRWMSSSRCSTRARRRPWGCGRAADAADPLRLARVRPSGLLRLRRRAAAGRARYGIQLPDRELVCAPIDSPEGQRYLAAMACAANYAFANRQILAHHARAAFEEVLRGQVARWELHQVYDVAHNMGKLEKHTVGGRREHCVRPPQGRHARLRPRVRRTPAAVPPSRAARPGPREYGHGLLGAAGRRSEHADVLRILLPRRRPHHEPPPGPAVRTRRAAAPGPRAGRRARARRIARGAGRRSRRRPTRMSTPLSTSSPKPASPRKVARLRPVAVVKG